MTQPIILEQEWMKLMGPTISCSVIHPHASCTFQILSKCLQVVKKSSKLYALLYFAMFAVQFKKIHRQRKIRKTILNWTQDYLWSLCFMSWMVGGMKSILCLLNNLGFQLSGRVAPLLSTGASPALYYLQKSRRPEMLPFHIYFPKEAFEIEDIFIKIAIFYFSIWIIKLYVFRKAGLSQEQKYTSVTMGLVLNFLLIFFIFLFTFTFRFYLILLIKLSIAQIIFKMHQIKLINKIQPDDIIQISTSIIINRYHLPTAQDLVQYPISEEDNFMMIKSQQGKNKNQFFLIITVTQIPTKEEQLAIQKSIGLSDRVICIELDQQLQSKIQKYYLGVIPELYARYTESKNCIQKPLISFVNQSYRKLYSRQAQGIYYYKTLQQFNTNRLVIQTIKENILSLSSLDTLKIFKELPKNNRIDFPAMTVKQFLTIYNSSSLSYKDAAQLKYSMLSYKEEIYNNQKKLRAEQSIFNDGANDVNKSILRQISKQNLPKKQMAQLEWKHSRLRIFSDLIWEQKMNRQLVKKYKNCSLFDLQIQIIILDIQEFYREWITNTFKSLKLSFNLIANRRDIKALTQFRILCEKVKKIVKKCKQQSKKLKKNQKLVEQMKKQIDQFIVSHENVIKDEYLNSLKYFKYQMKYMWKNEPKIYHRIGLFCLILILAYMQKNIIIGITLISIGLILSAINI